MTKKQLHSLGRKLKANRDVPPGKVRHIVNVACRWKGGVAKASDINEAIRLARELEARHC